MPNTTTTVAITWGAGQSVLYAGTPLSETGVVVNGSGAYGILAEDLFLPDRLATVITAGEWDDDISRANGIPLTDECKRALSGIDFKNPAKTTDVGFATLDTAGIVYQADVPDVDVDATPIEIVTAVVQSLMDAGIMAEPDDGAPSDEGGDTPIIV